MPAIAGLSGWHNAQGAVASVFLNHEIPTPDKEDILPRKILERSKALAKSMNISRFPRSGNVV